MLSMQAIQGKRHKQKLLGLRQSKASNQYWQKLVVRVDVVATCLHFQEVCNVGNTHIYILHKEKHLHTHCYSALFW